MFEQTADEKGGQTNEEVKYTAHLMAPDYLSVEYESVASCRATDTTEQKRTIAIDTEKKQRTNLPRRAGSWNL